MKKLQTNKTLKKKQENKQQKEDNKSEEQEINEVNASINGYHDTLPFPSYQYHQTEWMGLENETWRH